MQDIIYHVLRSIDRLELSLLVRRYREVTVYYYIHGKSCSEISAEMGISVEMVEYYFFKTRKILKEGINTTAHIFAKVTPERIV